MALSADRDFQARDGVYVDLAATAATQFYKGQIVSIVSATGLALGFVASSGDQFGGICTEKKLTVTGDKITVRRKGIVRITGQSGFAASAVGELIYASADDTVTLTATNNLLIGRVVQFESASVIWVDLAPA
jgi:hypothetical protein